MPNSTILKTITLNDGTYNNTLPIEDTTARSSITNLSNSLATVATTGAYSDLSGTPALATVATTGDYSDLTSTPALADVATSGDYDDLTNKPTIPDAVSGVNDGTNWTSITIGGTTKAIPSGGNATLSGLTDTTISSPLGGQVLKYNNSSSKWENANETKELPSVTGNASKVLAVNSGATGVEWVTLTGLPSQTGNQGKFLATDGLSTYWTYFGHDISHTTNTSVTTSTTVTFVANKRCSQMVSTAADLAVTFEVNNDADNYLWVKNTGSSEIDITISGVSYNNSSVTNVYMPSDGISVPAGNVCEIGVVCNDDGAFITSRSDLSL